MSAVTRLLLPLTTLVVLAQLAHAVCRDGNYTDETRQIMSIFGTVDMSPIESWGSTCNLMDWTHNDGYLFWNEGTNIFYPDGKIHILLGDKNLSGYLNLTHNYWPSHTYNLELYDNRLTGDFPLERFQRGVRSWDTPFFIYQIDIANNEFSGSLNFSAIEGLAGDVGLEFVASLDLCLSIFPHFLISHLLSSPVSVSLIVG